MEIAHNVLHAQWDWMKDPNIQSSTWEWDTMSPSDRWMHSHNVVHHTWTNVLHKDLDVGYGIMRVTPLQKWKPRHLFQTVYCFLLMMFFEEGVAVHEEQINEVLAGRRKLSQCRPLLRHIGRKVWRQVLKDYVMWPGAAALVALPLALIVPVSPLMAFGLVAGANAVANFMRNIWSHSIIFCGHFPEGVHNFTQEQIVNETRGGWYVRQLLGSCNIGGGKLFHILSGNLSHQIEHHLFPDMPSNRYPEVAPRVRALAARYGLPYNTGTFARQLGTTWWKIAKLSLPGPAPAAGQPQPA
jgi:fatty acid desaturase